MNMFSLFATLRKVDEEKRLVFARASQEVVDRSGEIFDYETSVPYVKSWSDLVKSDTSGKSLGNVRGQHGAVAAGKIQEISFNDDEKAIDVVIKVVDDGEWNKVLEGVYTGCSFGGEYVKRWSDGKNKRYTANPSELSLVDRPCVPTAKFFDIVKSDGSTMQKAFQNSDLEGTPNTPNTPEEDASGNVKPLNIFDGIEELSKLVANGEITSAQILELVRKTNKQEVTPDGDYGDDAEAGYADPGYQADKKPRYPLKKEGALSQERIRSAWNYINKVANADEYTGKQLNEIKGKIVTAWKDGINKDGPSSTNMEKGELRRTFGLLEGSEEDLKKSMYEVGRLSDLVQSLAWLATCSADEAKIEGDNSPVPAKLLAAVENMASILLEMANEEVAELVEATKKKSGMDSNITVISEILAMSEKPADLQKAEDAIELFKAGARNSKTDMGRIQKAHDSMVELGAKCSASGKFNEPYGDMVSKLEKAEIAGQLSKAMATIESMASDKSSLRKELSAMRKDIDELKTKVEKLPAGAARPPIKTFGKSDDAAPYSIEPLQDNNLNKESPANDDRQAFKDALFGENAKITVLGQ